MSERKSRTFSMSDEEYEALTVLAKREGRTRTQQIIKMVQDEIEKAERA